MFGKVVPKFAERKWAPGVIITGALFTGSWGYLVYTGDIRNIWPLFGMSNQLLAATALIICTTVLIRMDKAKYMWVTAGRGFFSHASRCMRAISRLPMVYLAPGKENYLLATLACMVLAMIVIVVISCFKRWAELLQIKERVTDIWGERVIMPLRVRQSALLTIQGRRRCGQGATEKWG